MSVNALKDLQEMAKDCGISEDEFNKVNDKPKFYDVLDCDNTAVLKSEKDIVIVVGEKLKAYFDIDNVKLSNSILRGVEVAKFKKGSVVNMRSVAFLPKKIDVSDCAYFFTEGCDFDNDFELNFGEGSTVHIEVMGLLPKNLDVSKCASVTLQSCGAFLIKDFKFKDGAEVTLCAVNDLPKNLDVSNCSIVTIKNCDVRHIEELKFREGSEAYLEYITEMPKSLDVSMCDKVVITDCDFWNVKTLKLRNSDQKKLLENELKFFQGEIIYTEENSMMKKFAGLFGMGM